MSLSVSLNILTMGFLMKTKTDIMELIGLICDFYNCYHEILDYTHDKAKLKTENIYSDIHEWLYDD